MATATQELPSALPAHKPGTPWTIQELARFMTVSERTVAQLVTDGKLRGFKFGARRLFTDEEVRQIMAGG